MHVHVLAINMHFGQINVNALVIFLSPASIKTGVAETQENVQDANEYFQTRDRFKYNLSAHYQAIKHREYLMMLLGFEYGIIF